MDQGTPSQRSIDFSHAADQLEGQGKRVCPSCGLKLSAEITICPNDGTVLSSNQQLTDKLSSQYEFLAEIGSGGMGVIYKARHIALNQTVAIKMLHMNRIDEISVRRFQQEAKAVSALDHPSIVRVRDFGVTEAGQPHMVLDFIEGHTLSKAIEKNAGLQVPEGLEIFIQACDALEHAHARGVLHRDLKPSNMMLVTRLSGPPLVKIVDFGIAKIADPDYGDSVSNLTQTGEVFGSPLYMSPEQASGSKLDMRSDIYSFGCVMYETLTGAPPFVGGSSIETIFRQLNDKAPTLKEGSLGREFPEQLEDIVAKCLEKKPEARFQSMADLKRSLIDLKFGKVSTRNVGAPTQVASVEQANKKRNEIKALGLALAALSILAAVSSYFVINTLHKPVVVPVTVDDGTRAKQIISSQINATSIDVHGLQLNDKMLELFAAPTKATSVNLDNTAVEGPGLANLIHLPLSNLSLAESRLTDRGLEEIRHMENLKVLNLRKTAISDFGLYQLKSLKSLETVDLSENPVGHAAASVTSYWPKLKDLALNKTSIEGTESLSKLAKNKSLKSLSLNGCAITAKDVQALAPSQLETLSVENTQIDDSGLKSLESIKSLRKINIQGCKNITGQGLAALKSSRPDLEVIKDGEPPGAKQD